MITKDRIFKKGDVIVSGFGNIRIFTDEKFEGDSYKCLTCYCSSDLPAGTDMRYARHATTKEKELFFNALKANGLCFVEANLWIGFVGNFSIENLAMAKINWKADGPQPYKVMKKRVRPTLSQIRLLEEKMKLRDEIIRTHCKEKVELKDHLDEVKGYNEKMAKDLAKMAKDLTILQEDNEKLKAKNTTLEQSNKLMEAELTLQKGRVSELTQSDKEGKDYIDYLLGRGFFARLFNLK